MGKGPPPPSHLSNVLRHLNTGPRLSVNGLRRMGLTLAARNDHFGARHFVKEQLPRIRWANPSLDIQVKRVQKKREDVFQPELLLEYENGTSRTIDMANKWSTTIAKELMDLAGGDAWKAYKAAATAAGQPILPGEEKERLPFAARACEDARLQEKGPQELEAQVKEMLSAPGRSKTGAAAILP